MKKVLLSFIIFLSIGLMFGNTGFRAVSKQAAGNAIGYQWGIYTSVDYQNLSDSMGYIKSAEWLPAYYDTYKEPNDNSANSVSPIENTSDYIHFLKRYTTAQAIEDGRGGEIIQITWETKKKWKKDPFFGHLTSMDEWYFNRKIARHCNMRVYLQGKDIESNNEWYVGPIHIYDKWEESELIDQFGIKRGEILNPDLLPNGKGCWSHIENSLNRITTVVSVGNRRVAFGIKDITNDVLLKLETAVYGNDPENDNNGAISFCVRQPSRLNPEYSQGAITSHSVNMYVGSVKQLVDLGYWIPEYETKLDEKLKEGTPQKFKLYDNYPNPFNPTTTIKFDVPRADKFTLNIFNIQGKRVKTVNFGNLSAGTYQYRFNASDLSSGIYFYKLESDDFRNIKKMTYIK